MSHRFNSLKKNIHSSILFRITCRFVLYLFLQAGVFFMLYVSGNFQGFMDRTQNFLLVLCFFTLAALFLFSASGCIQCIVLRILHKRRKYWFYFILFLLLALISIGLIFFISALSFISGGLH
ncbi:hypothetical protein [Treponema sp.]|uniref:hypothetical protein n=1 Tax=Treponema sp. TaxID=166 RepID=UPI0025CBDE06|nr:hypothetical protein [Treponema sp.]MCR5218858.1 hypothetical protein [Treponema sp.]